MSDMIIRATSADNNIRAFAAQTRKMVEDARQAHNTSPVMTAALGRLMTAAAMMGSMMKNEKGVITLKITGNGPAKGLLVTADAKANVKGYANNPQVLIHAKANGKLDVAGALGQGTLQVIQDTGMKEPYVGQTELVSGEIAEDLSYYFAASEQIPSSVGLGVLMNRDNTVRQAGGFILQLMPGAPEEIVTILENNVKNVTSVTNLLDQGHTAESMLGFMLGDLGMQVTDRIPTKFYCDCSRNKVEKAIISLGRKEIEDIIKDQETIEVNCHFCNKHYLFTVDELKNIRENLS